MKKNITVILLLSFCNYIHSQNIGINTTGAAANASAILDLNTGNNGTKGFLPEQVVLSASNVAAPVSAPAIGLIVYNTSTAGSYPTNVVPGYYYWNGSNWIYLIKNSKASVPIPYFTKACNSVVYYNPGYNILKASGSDYFAGAPATLEYYSAYEGDNNYVITSNGNFSKVCGWLNAATGGNTVTVYVYVYSPVNNSSANITGTLIGSQTVTLTTVNANYYYEIAANTALTKGQFIKVWFKTSAAMTINQIGVLECT